MVPVNVCLMDLPADYRPAFKPLDSMKAWRTFLRVTSKESEPGITIFGIQRVCGGLPLCKYPAAFKHLNIEGTRLCGWYSGLDKWFVW